MFSRASFSRFLLICPLFAQRKHRATVTHPSLIGLAELTRHDQIVDSATSCAQAATSSNLD
jgi:hypothetical protein